ncbi:MAG: hypothetical protein Ct9H90mP9_1310 [Pseudomonadota bacterium]|nr:MAG: hypothetical protein Ct9H90mP9_1310 [Pseudomonadota bacterium]
MARPGAEKTLQENGLPVNDENVFIASSCESKGIDFLLGKAKENIRRKSAETAKTEKTAAPKSVPTAAPALGPREYTITVEGKAYQVQVAKAVGVRRSVLLRRFRHPNRPPQHQVRLWKHRLQETSCGWKFKQEKP